MITNTATHITFALYLLATLLIGGIGYYATRDLSDYILGGRRLGSVVTALSAGASDMSGWLLMGLPGAIYLTGLSGAWIAIGLVIGAWLNWRFVASRLRNYTEKCNNAQTLPDYLTYRFQDTRHILRIVTSLVILIFFTLYCAAGVVASARLFESLFGLSYPTALWIGALATMAYVFIGGFLAVSWTDALQASLMLTALLMVPLMVIFADGGMHHSIETVRAFSSGHLNLLHHLDTIAIISLLGWGLGYFGQPHILVRFMAAESARVIPRARAISIVWMILCLIGAVAVGFFGLAYFLQHPDMAATVNANAETIFIELSRQLFNPWIAGILLAAILAAVMSTLSCQLLVCSSVLTQDIYKNFLRKAATQRELVWFGRLMVLAVTLVAIWLAQDPNGRVLKMVSYAWAGFGAAFGPIILFSLFSRRVTLTGALAGIITGAVTVLIWKQYQWFGLYEIVPGFLFSALAIVLGSLSGQPPLAGTTLFNEEKRFV
jgi:sodium/proline symporter